MSIPITKIAQDKSSYVHFHLVYIAPTPVLPRFHRTHNRMLCRMKMFRRVSMKRGVAAPHMPALQAHSQMHPVTVNLETLLASLRRWFHLPDLVHMSTLHRSHLPSSMIVSRTVRTQTTPVTAIRGRPLANSTLSGQSPNSSEIPYSFSFRYSVVFPIPSSFAAISLSPFN